MNLATLRLSGKYSVAIVDPAHELFWRVSNVFDDLPNDAASDMTKFIAWAAGRKMDAPTKSGEAFEEKTLCAPILNPPHNILCVGKNYREHIREFSNSGFDTSGGSGISAIPELPIIFTKPSSSLNSPSGVVEVAVEIGQSIDYEAELAVVIGKGGRRIPSSQAMQHVFGYTIVNDVTARDVQQRHKQWFLGKGIDGFCPMGPWIVTADQALPADFRVISRVNGEERQNAPVTDLIFDIPTLIETISRSMTLSPGDVISTGTPAGVGIGFNPPKFLRDGDVVECEIPQIGVLRNEFRFESV